MTQIPAPTEKTRALISPVEGTAEDAVRVHFNPVSLQFQVSNALRDPQEKETDTGSKRQFVTKSTAKLSMDLVFDTTDTGVDVRELTSKLLTMMHPDSITIKKVNKKDDGKRQTPKKVKFEWGRFVFTGIIEQYKEVFDFFSHEGVPLRSTLSLTLASQENVFGSKGNQKAPKKEGDTQKTNQALRKQGPSGTNAARKLNEYNKVENPRNPQKDKSESPGGKDDHLRSGKSVSQAPVRNPKAGGSLGGGFNAGLSAGFSGGANLSGGLNAGFNAQAGASFSAGLNAQASSGLSVGSEFDFGAQGGGEIGGALSGAVNGVVQAGVRGATGFRASAGADASVGAGFKGLWGASPSRQGAGFDFDALFERSASASVSVSQSTSFGVTGRASASRRHTSVSGSTTQSQKTYVIFEEEG